MKRISGIQVLAAGAVVAFTLGTAGVASASKCDAGITKAAGKKVSCKAGVVAKAQQKNTSPDATKLAKCEAKFSKACTKAQSAGDCSAQTESCAATEAQADACVTTISTSASPSGAFLE